MLGAPTENNCPSPSRPLHISDISLGLTGKLSSPSHHSTRLQATTKRTTTSNQHNATYRSTLAKKTSESVWTEIWMAARIADVAGTDHHPRSLHKRRLEHSREWRMRAHELVREGYSNNHI
jgi:hypothetical protein